MEDFKKNPEPIESKIIRLSINPAFSDIFLTNLCEELIDKRFPQTNDAFKNLLKSSFEGEEEDPRLTKTLSETSNYAKELEKLGNYEKIKAFCGKHEFPFLDEPELEELVKESLEVMTDIKDDKTN